MIMKYNQPFPQFEVNSVERTTKNAEEAHLMIHKSFAFLLELFEEQFLEKNKNI